MTRRIAPLALAAMLLALAVGPTQAAATRLSFSSMIIDTVAQLPDEGPGSNWVSGNVVHVRNAVVTDTVVGDFEGSLERLVNFNLNQATGQSTAWCSFTWTSAFDTWEGRCRGSLLDGTLRARGLNGTLMFATYELAPGGIPAVGPYLILGEILIPGG